ncbi:uncharacterized protein LOC126879876 isoform X1 [Diabrotica virgifera virgifera]|uniref:Uncharacterized protein LOC114336059 isoform X1 n=1 Tax=Diabrotica virgifera virgifera TaxID=50390 RepID=A0A6P7G594_DIAVI|nr:uncharacterized protein LOC126879876 isoform X1 [Diabrotica virgifera virgifera]
MCICLFQFYLNQQFLSTIKSVYTVHSMNFTDTPDDIAAFSAPFAQIQQLAEKEQLAEFIETFDQFKLAMADFNSKIEEHVEQMKTLGRLDDVIAADLTEDEAEQDIVKEEVLVQQ